MLFLPFQNTFWSKFGGSTDPDTTNSKASCHIFLRMWIIRWNWESQPATWWGMKGRDARIMVGTLTMQLDEYDATRSPGCTPCCSRAETRAVTSSYSSAYEHRRVCMTGNSELGSAVTEMSEDTPKRRSASNWLVWMRADLVLERQCNIFSAQFTRASWNLKHVQDGDVEYNWADQGGFEEGRAELSTMWLPLWPMMFV